MRNRYGDMLEINMTELFSKNGWECNRQVRIKDTSGRIYIPDITLTKDGKEYGFVECVYGDISEQKIKQIMYMIDMLKPQLFILTDGVSFEVYLDSKYIGTMNTPLSYESFVERSRLLEYYNAILED